MKKRAFAVFLVAILLLGILPGTALAVDPKGDITNGLTISSADDAAAKAGDYTTTGNGTVEVAYDDTTNTVTFTLTNATLSGPLSVNGGLKAAVVLSGKNSITVDGEVNAIAVHGDLTISGTGELTAEASDWPAIWSHGLVVDEATVQATSNANGFSSSSISIQNGAAVSGECGYPLLYATGSITIDGSAVNATTDSNGIYTDGTLTIRNRSTVTAAGYYTGIFAGSDITIQNSTVEASGWEYNGGILGGSDVSITGGSKVTASAVDAQGIQVQGNLEISGAATEVNISNTSDSFFALTVNGHIKITGGTTTVSSTGNEGIYPHGDLTLSGGSLSVTSQGHGLYMPDSALNVSGGELTVVSEGDDPGIRSDSMNISGGTVSVDCPHADHPIALNDSDNGLTYTGGTLNLPGVKPEGGITISDTVYFLVIFDFGYKGERKSELIKQGEKIAIADPERTNFTFNGWYDAPSDGNKWDLESDTVTANMLLYAQWTSHHQHIWSDEWTSNQTHHWYACLGDDCNYVSNSQNKGYALHTPGPAATCTEPQVCTVCSYELAAALGHSLGGWQSNATSHWKTCSVCGEKAENAAHVPGEWVIDREATSSAAGQRHKACTVCGYITETEIIPISGGGSSDDDASEVVSGGGSSAPTYRPEVAQPGEGGSVSISANTPKRGDPVTIIPRPDAGYEVDTVTVTDQNGHAVEVRKNADGTYTFIQPGSRVRIEVTYQRAQPAQPVETPWSSPFADVSQGDWYYEAVRFVQEQGLMNGYGDGRFGPDDTLSRAQLVQILFNREGRPVVHALPDFSDVADEAWYAGAVRWAAGRGIAGGYGDGRFGPNDPITREQLAVMLWRYAGSPAAGGELPFDDADKVSPFAREAVGWAVESGILRGGGDGQLHPGGLATRAQAAQMLKNFLEKQ